jgi:hypothetical protein
VTAPLRDASELLWPAVQETLAALGLGSEDSAARRLAQRYAQVIDGLPDREDGTSERAHDQAWGLRWIGPLLLDCLVQLGATPASRAQIDKGTKAGGGSQPDAAPTQLDRLRASRASRRTP